MLRLFQNGKVIQLVAIVAKTAICANFPIRMHHSLKYLVGHREEIEDMSIQYVEHLLSGSTDNVCERAVSS